MESAAPSPQLDNPRQGNILLVGEGAAAEALRAATSSLGFETRREGYPDVAVDQVDEATAVLMIAPPLRGMATPRVVARLAQVVSPEGIHLDVVIGEDAPAKLTGALYKARAQAVYRWPRERTVLLTDLIAAFGEPSPWRQTPADRALQRAVKDRVRRGGAGCPGITEMMVMHGVAFLAGEVKSLADLDACAEALARTPGLRRIVTRHVTVTDRQVTDHQLAGDVYQVLESAAPVHGSQIVVSVEEGRVRLEGEVRHRRDARRVVELARHVTGVRSIEDAVTVTNGGGISDETLSQLLAAAFPDSRALAVKTFDGVAVLEGVVTRASTRREVETQVRVEVGRRVVNKLQVGGPR
jgi:osmotically-inducible protein OsmY